MFSGMSRAGVWPSVPIFSRRMSCFVPLDTVGDVSVCELLKRRGESMAYARACKVPTTARATGWSSNHSSFACSDQGKRCVCFHVCAGAVTSQSLWQPWRFGDGRTVRVSLRTVAAQTSGAGEEGGGGWKLVSVKAFSRLTKFARGEDDSARSV